MSQSNTSLAVLLDFTHNPNTISIKDAKDHFEMALKPSDSLINFNSRLSENLTATTQQPLQNFFNMKGLAELPCMRLIKDFRGILEKIQGKFDNKGKKGTLKG
jgi:hypothetical protein